MAKHKAPSKRRHYTLPTSAKVINYKADRAAMLDRLADLELQHGHHLAAERLAHQANELREAGR